ncbi:hypothetical protein TrLO_g9767 [Triparma laevis f. longispina]|uniref:Uncharacterized protein n=1 Tax=Triparma laevis f. longispina TaxID=1714387 RepID=A0A9W7FRB5_9STRA|nr:hypothetical protein TrLO_g9767 [Triparma laevis f. longispina]
MSTHYFLLLLSPDTMSTNEDSSSSDNLSLSPAVVGAVGFPLYLTLSLLVLYRLLHHLRLSGPTPTLRKTFHILLLLNTTLETCSYIPFTFLGGTTYTKWSYILHLLSVAFDLIAFSCVTVQWSRINTFTVGFGNKILRKRVSLIVALVLLVDILFLLFTLSVCVTLSLSSDSLSEWANKADSYKRLLICEPIALTLNASCVIIYGIKMVRRLLSLRTWSSLPSPTKLRILSQALGVMFTCAGCYLLRGGLCLAQYHELIGGGEMIETDLIWWMGAIWVPTVVPSLLLLFSMRNLDRKVEEGRTPIGLMGDVEERNSTASFLSSEGRGSGEGDESLKEANSLGGGMHKSLLRNEFGGEENDFNEKGWKGGEERAHSITF